MGIDLEAISNQVCAATMKIVCIGHPLEFIDFEFFKTMRPLTDAVFCPLTKFVSTKFLEIDISLTESDRNPPCDAWTVAPASWFSFLKGTFGC